MLVSAVQNNDYGYFKLQVEDVLSEFNEKEELKGQEELTEKKNFNEKENLSNGLTIGEYCDSFLNRYKVSKQTVLSNRTFENVCKEDEESCKDGEVKQPPRELTVGFKCNSDEGNNSVKMEMKSEKSCIENDRCSTRFTPEVKSNQNHIRQCGDFENSVDNLNSTKTCSNPFVPATEKNFSRDSKVHLSTDDDTNFDIFDLMKCSEDEVTDCAKSDCDKDELPLNEDLVSKYENNLGLDIVKDKDICWAAGNFDSELCPLKNYDICNENSLLSFVGESLDGGSRESFSQEWTFDDSIHQVSQEQVPDPHVIVPKKTVDITKIKGWRKKQFTVERCLANRNSILKKSKENSKWDDSKSVFSLQDAGSGRTGDDPNKDYAFVCDKLDDFLDQEAELKINYEIPHLYAEYGIKLTSEELVSRPKFKPSTVINRLPVKISSKSVLPQKHANVPSVGVENIKTEEIHTSKASPIKKPMSKVKCAFPNKSHKNWSLWKENNLAKGKPLTLLKKELLVKKENTTEVTPSCRRSGRISQVIQTKPNAVVQAFVNERRSVLRKKVTGSDCKVEAHDRKPIFHFGNDYNFQIRKFGMVLYPGPSAPLNPFITYHLQKIRSYRTLIDKNWANFSVSTVVQKGETSDRKRMILPLTCCFKYKNEPCKVETDLPKENSSDVKDVTSEVETKVEEDPKLADKEGQRKVIAKNEEISEKTELGDRKRISRRRRESSTRLSTDSALTKKINDGKFDLYEEEIKCGDETQDEVDMANSNSIDNGSDYTKNSSDDSNECDIVFEKRGQKSSIGRCLKENLKNTPEVIDIEDDDTNLSSTVVLSPNSSQTPFNRIITKLLTDKLNELKQSDNVTNSIDNLKTVKPNVLELIKLNFIKENYQSGYINLWYVKSPETGKSRVFLTFSMNPPVDGAITLKMMSRLSESNLPNIIQEIISKHRVFDPNDFAILYCDGNHWEIHGSVNFQLNKRDAERDESEKIQVFHLTKKIFPELEMLHDIKQKNDKNKVLKWWVMHMTQDYTEIIVQYGGQTGRISRSIILKTWRTKVPSFIEFKGLQGVRPIGVGVNPRLWPYFLIGPYYMGDHHNLTLKLNSNFVPFEYYLPLDRVKPAFLLKRFVSSVIMHSWRNCRQVVGMWLYDRIGMNQSSFIQVRTRVKKGGNYQPTVEHDYSLSQTEDGLLESKLDDSEKVPREKIPEPTEEVFLVPSLPHLGYIKGELHPDKSVTIRHPIQPGKKKKSERIGDWLNGVLRRRITFFPKELHIRWKIVKSAALVSHLQPLKRSFLGGTHLLCKKGIFYLLSLTKEKVEELGLDESFVVDAILNNQIIQEVVEMKELGKMLLGKDICDVPMTDVLRMALVEIKALQKEEKSLGELRMGIEKERESLCQKYLEALDNCDVDENSKRTINFYVSVMLERGKNGEEKSGNLKREQENFRRLEAIDKFLQGIQVAPQEKEENPEESGREAEKNCDVEIVTESPSESTKDENNSTREKFKVDSEKVRELESKIKLLHESLNKMNGDDVNLRELLTKRLNAMSNHLEKLKTGHNANGKLLPALSEGIDRSSPQRSHLNQDDEGLKDGKKKLSVVQIICQKKNTVKVIKERESRAVDSSVQMTEIKKTQNASTSLTNHAKEKQPTEIKSSNENEDGHGKKVAGITLDDSSNDPKCNGPENLVDSAKSNREEATEMIAIDEPEIEVLHERKAILSAEGSCSKSWKHSSEGGFPENVRLKRNSVGDEKVQKKLSDRIDCENGRQSFRAGEKRVGDEISPFLKKRKTS